VTFVDIAPGDPQLMHRKESVERVLLRAGTQRDKQNDLGRLAGFHLDGTSRATLGVLLAGTVQSVERHGDYYATNMVLFGLPKEVTVISRARPPLKPNDKALVAGSIVEQPREKLPNYRGTLALAVWGGLPVKLPSDENR
jgi:hypothetical protein